MHSCSLQVFSRFTVNKQISIVCKQETVKRVLSVSLPASGEKRVFAYTDLSLAIWKKTLVFLSQLSSVILRPSLPLEHRAFQVFVLQKHSYRPSSVVCRSVGLSVCRSVALVSPAKTAAPIELPFGLRTWVGPGDHVLDGGLHCESKKGATLTMAITLSILDRLTKFFHCCKEQ